MNTTDLVEKLAAAQGVTKAAAKAIVDDILKAIADAAAAGEEINFPGFGKFKIKDVPARTARNPSTGAAIEVAASKKVTFAPAKALKDKLNA